jgi:hypothetical protein
LLLSGNKKETEAQSTSQLPRGEDMRWQCPRDGWVGLIETWTMDDEEGTGLTDCLSELLGPGPSGSGSSTSNSRAAAHPLTPSETWMD